MTRIEARRIVTPDGVVGPGALLVDDGRIAAIESLPEATGVPDRTLAPGFVELQVNGIGDIDIGEADGADWAGLDEALLAQGVTTWCPTLISAPLDSYADRLARVAQAQGHTRTTIAGAHLEGPFLARPGAHDPTRLRAVDLAWLEVLPPLVRIVTLAPEVDGALEAVAGLARRGVLVSVGHTQASPSQIGAAIDAGARLATHVFNGMPAFHHRQAGPAGAVLVDDRVAVSVIADLVHVDATALRLVFQAKPPGMVVLVTDAVAGDTRLADGTLAGSRLTMDGAVRNAVNAAGVSLEAAVAAASTTPARLLGLDDRGTLAVGQRADIVALDPDLAVESVWVAGQPAGRDVREPIA
jgi:N-acetylglucosamine-6-phosphate deacetylase